LTQGVQVTFGMALAKVDREVCHPTGMGAVTANGSGAERSTSVAKDAVGDVLDDCPGLHRAAPGGSAGIVGIVIDCPSVRVEDGATGGQCRIDGSQVRQLMWLVVDCCPKVLGHTERASVPACGDARTPMPEPGPIGVRIRAADPCGFGVEKTHCARIGTAHADGRPTIRDGAYGIVLGRSKREDSDAVISLCGEQHVSADFGA
jgi:hypothetical protein